MGPHRAGGRVPSALLLTELFPPAVGGTPVLFEAIYTRLGVPTLVLADDTVGAAEDGGADGLRVVRRPIRTRQWGLTNIKGLLHHLRTAQWARTIGPRRDVVWHCARALPEGVAAWLSRAAFGPPYVCWAHGEDVVTAMQSRELTWLMTRVYAGASANIVNSANTGRLLEALGIAADRIHVVYPGVDAGRFHPEVDGSRIRARFANTGDILLLSVGRLQRRKGHDLAIEAMARLDRSLGIRYVIVGDGDERGYLEQIVARHGLHDRVHFAGEVPADDLPRYYAACDIFLLPNRVHDGDIEGFGIVFLEAAASVRPAIGGRSGGVPEAIVDGETGLLVSGTDAGELAEAMARLAGSPDMRSSMGLAGRARAVRDFTWQRAAARVAEIHAAVAGNKAV